MPTCKVAGKFGRLMGCAFAVAICGAPAVATTIGYYQFEDSPGFLVDSSAASHNLTASTSSPTQVASPFGATANPPAGSVANSEAANFSLASTQSFSAADPGTYSDFTFEAFVKPATVATSGSNARVIASQFDNTNGVFSFGLPSNASTTFTRDRAPFIQLLTGGTTRNVQSTFQLTLNTSYYVAVVVDVGGVAGGTAVTFYVRDLSTEVMQSETIEVAGLTSINNSNLAFTVGGRVGGSQFDGVLDEVRFSDTALSQSELLVPEPGSAAVLAIAVGCLTLRRRKASLVTGTSTRGGKPRSRG